MQCLQQQPPSAILHPSASNDPEESVVKSMLEQGSIVCLYTSRLEQVVVNRYTGELDEHRRLFTGRIDGKLGTTSAQIPFDCWSIKSVSHLASIAGLDGLHEFPAKLLFQVDNKESQITRDNAVVIFSLKCPFM